jgi:deoxyadenosine/deoxycytidine kinase
MNTWISGPTGAGKTSLCQIFRTLGYAIVEERFSQRTFAAFAADPIRHCALLQEEIMRSRFEGWKMLTNTSRVVFDRSIDEDVHVFCKMHFELGFLTDKEFQHLRDTARQLQSLLPTPDLIIFMCPSSNILVSRVTGQSHPLLIVKNLERQISLYSDWLKTRPDNILLLDNSRCSPGILQRLFGGKHDGEAR